MWWCGLRARSAWARMVYGVRDWFERSGLKLLVLAGAVAMLALGVLGMWRLT